MLTPGRRRVQSQQVLDGEDENTRRVETEERVAVVLAARHSDARHQATADRLGYVGQHRRRDEKPATNA